MAYYITDSAVADASTDMGVRVAVGVPFGPALGAIGSAVRRSGAVWPAATSWTERRFERRGCGKRLNASVTAVPQ